MLSFKLAAQHATVDNGDKKKIESTIDDMNKTSTSNIGNQFDHMHVSLKQSEPKETRGTIKAKKERML